jgi:hypothetical protein
MWRIKTRSTPIKMIKLGKCKTPNWMVLLFLIMKSKNSRNVCVNQYNTREHPHSLIHNGSDRFPRAEREDNQANNDGALILENMSASVLTTRTEETSIGRWKIR